MADISGRALLDALYAVEPVTPAWQKESTANIQREMERRRREEEARRRAQHGMYTTGAGEAALTALTGMAGSVPAGLAGLGTLAYTRDPEKAAQTVEDVQGALTYMPRTPSGMERLQELGNVFSTIGAPAEYLGEKTLQYTGSPAAATAVNIFADPINYIGTSAPTAAAKGAVRGAKAMGKEALRQIDRSMMGEGPLSALTAGPLYAVKPKGGNWLAGEVESTIEPLKSETVAGETPAERIPRHHALLNDPTLPAESRATVQRHLDDEINRATIDNWIDKKLGRYIKNEMGTPEDPVRRLAEQGILHYDPRPSRVHEANAALYRNMAGTEQHAKSDLATRWENISDAAIMPDRAEMHQEFASDRIREQNPWLAKVDPQSKVYSVGAPEASDLGFDHIVDVLKEDLATGRLTPEQLNKVSMEQAVRRTHEYNQELAKKAAEAKAAARADLPVYRAYPEGYRWIELNKPGSFAAESDAMGHSVRGYEPPKGHPDWTSGSGDSGSPYYGHGGWEAIKSGKAKVYSLVDSKGQPHVTVEARAGNDTPYDLWFRNRDLSDPEVMEFSSWLKKNPQLEGGLEDWYLRWADATGKQVPPVPFKITQIKGKQNKAPKDEYLPFVQDFVKNDNWHPIIGDFRNTGLFRVEPGQRLPGFAKEITPGFYTLEDFKRMAAENEMPQEIQDTWFNKLKDQSRYGYARGGSVHISDNADVMKLALLS